jgi:hypothetical protein
VAVPPIRYREAHVIGQCLRGKEPLQLDVVGGRVADKAKESLQTDADFQTLNLLNT